MTALSPGRLWEAALGELQLQLARPMYETFLQETLGLRLDGHCLVVGVPSPFVAEFLEKRLCTLIERTVEGLAHCPLALRFVVASLDQPSPTPQNGLHQEAPLPPAEAQAARSTPLQSSYSFETFVVGNSNQLAHAAAIAVAQAPGRKYNPLFIYSATGLGKTHLLHAIGRSAAHQGLQVVCVSAEQFTNEFIHAIRGGTTTQFRGKYHNADLLLMDDVQFLSGKEQTQESFFHIFNELYHANRQIVTTSDRSPKTLSLLTARLRSRFEWGLIADIQPPALETRLAILRAKAAQAGAHVPNAILELIAQSVSGSIRELEGALNRVVAYADLVGQPATVDLAQQALADLFTAPQRTPVTPDTVLAAVASFYGLDGSRLKGSARDKKTCLARNVAMYLLREDAHLSLAGIGRLLGGKDHSTVHHACKKVAAQLQEDASLQSAVASVRSTLNASQRC